MNGTILDEVSGHPYLEMEIEIDPAQWVTSVRDDPGGVLIRLVTIAS